MATKKGKANKTAQAQTSAGRTWPSGMDKLRDLTAEATDPFEKWLGERMTELLVAHPEWEAAIQAPGKDLHGLYQAFEDYARKHKSGDCYAGTPEDARKIICSYWGVSEADAGDQEIAPSGKAVAEARQAGGSPEAAQSWRQLAAATEKPAETPTTSETDPFDLDALIGGL